MMAGYKDKYHDEYYPPHVEVDDDGNVFNRTTKQVEYNIHTHKWACGKLIKLYTNQQSQDVKK